MTAALAAPAFYVRPETPADRNFVLSSWHRSVCSPWNRGPDEGGGTRHVEGPFFHRWQREMISAILARPSTVVEVASPAGDDTIAGWLCRSSTAPRAIYYVFVRENSRRVGIASTLLSPSLVAPAYYGALPARERDAGGAWSPPSWIGRLVPRTWRYSLRVNYHSVEVEP
jgi:hypothetical protein